MTAGGRGEPFHLGNHRLRDLLEQLHEVATDAEQLLHLLLVAAMHIVEVVTGRKDRALCREHHASYITVRDALEGVQELP